MVKKHFGSCNFGKYLCTNVLLVKRKKSASLNSTSPLKYNAKFAVFYLEVNAYLFQAS